MADEIKVKPTPIQRNKHDVAIELLQIYIERTAVNADDLESLYARFYALAQYVESKNIRSLQKLIPEEILKKAGEVQ